MRAGNSPLLNFTQLNNIAPAGPGLAQCNSILRVYSEDAATAETTAQQVHTVVPDCVKRGTVHGVTCSRWGGASADAEESGVVWEGGRIREKGAELHLWRWSDFAGECGVCSSK